MASKSANYCYLETSDGAGLLLLCEAQLGKPLYRCKHGDPKAASHCKTGVHIRLAASDGLGPYCNPWDWVILKITRLTVGRRTRPREFIDAKALSVDLTGVMMPAPDAPTETVAEADLTLQYDEVSMLSGAYINDAVHCVRCLASEDPLLVSSPASSEKQVDSQVAGFRPDIAIA